MEALVTPLILCGGTGSRLWPISRKMRPKQFIDITGQESLFQKTLSRLAKLSDGEILLQPFSIVAGEDHRFLVTDQLREMNLPLGRLLLEPKGRNTAPALTFAALASVAADQDPVLVVTPADHLVLDERLFTEVMRKAILEAAESSIVVLGVTPDRPEVGYGYIRAEGLGNMLTVDRFVEKPDIATAEAYLNEGGYFWNAGIFVLKASVWLKAISSFRPDILEATRRAWELRTEDGLTIRPDPDAFKSIPSESIDYAVMEPASRSSFPVKLFPLSAGWSDLGAWDAVWRSIPKDAEGNVKIGDVLVEDSRNCLVRSSGRLVTVLGVKDLVVIETADAVLVTDLIRSQNTKHLVTMLDTQSREESESHRKVDRPWGWYDSVDSGKGFKVKRIHVRPGGTLSLQKHSFRAEHWIVVTGTAQVTNGDEVKILKENQSTYIPTGQVHRLSNPGDVPLEIVEVQIGDYLGEDDIVRIEDNYGR